ncbi:MAG TPA: desaturase, partial [Myxococcota bacterium]|nr:desaturase [Myxococcota bacterium]
MSRPSFHDVIVVGTDLAGLMAAGLLQRHKYRTLLLGHGGLRSRYLHDGQPLPAAPLMLPLRGAAPGLDEVLAALAVEDPVHQLGDGGGVPAQVVTPSRRLDLGPDPVRLEAELERAWPEERAPFLARVAQAQRRQETLQALLTERPTLPPESFGERMRLRVPGYRWHRQTR